MTPGPSLKKRIGKLIPYPLIAAGRRVIHAGTDRCEVCGSGIRHRQDVGYGYPSLEQLQVVGGMRRNRDRCPICHSASRERLIWYYLTRRHFPATGTPPDFTVAHFAPEKGLSAQLLARFGAGYHAYDFAPARYRHLDEVQFQNLEALTLADASIDLLICNHVLEHVSSVPKALAEIRRVLKPSGLAILQVPIALKLEETREADGSEDDAARIRKFGQDDHLRLFSRSGYLASLAAAGLAADPFDPFADDAAAATRWMLDPFEELFLVRRPDGAENAAEAAIADPAQPEVSVAIVAYDAPDHLDRCLASIFAETRGCRVEVLVIDNGDGRCEALVRLRFPQVRIVPSEGNIGFGAGCNRAAALARADRLLFLNPDTRLRDDAISNLLAFARSKPEAGAWSGRTVTETGAFDGGNAIAVPSLGWLFLREVGLGRLTGRRIPYEQETAPRRADVLCGGFFMILSETWRELGGFDESFFLYCEETDLFVRLKALGREAWVVPGVDIVHDAGSGTRLSSGRLLLKSTGEMHFLRKHWSPPAAWIGGLLIWAGAALRYGSGLLLSGISGKGAVLRTAYSDVACQPARWFGGYRGAASVGRRGLAPAPGAAVSA